MFVNKIDLPYCLVVFFVGCPRLQADLKRFWRASAILSVPLLKERQGRTVIPGVSAARGE